MGMEIDMQNEKRLFLTDRQIDRWIDSMMLNLQVTKGDLLE